ncbi:MAG: aromatic ring-hydroxylating dioxygenase subunit alpha [Alphaproteobacteria bacterium]|nr:MAG: aromatic ring-hydroxylating dioxygenase subunit alpha [Alphaproteobacteria bacterium]
MLINQWYVAAHADDIGSEPLGVHMLGQDMVLFRDQEGQIHCLHDTCIHRGGSLCRGKVVEGAVQCPYHGWRYSGDGQCISIHSLGQDASMPKRARVDSYPVKEKWGFVWAFIGDLAEQERPPLPDFFSEYEENDGEWRFLRGTYVFECNWVRAIENGVDRTHAAFVHTDFGNPETGEVKPYEVKKTEHNIYTSSTVAKPVTKRGLWRQEIPDDRPNIFTEVQIQLTAPSIRIQMHMFPPNNQIIVTGYTPINEHQTRLHWIHSRNFLTDEKYDDDARKRMFTVLGEDAAILNYLKPAQVPPLLSDELLLANDKHGLEFRKWVKQQEASGKAIDTKAWNAETERIKALPSPGRRINPKNWILGTVPLKAPTSKSEAAE